MLQVLWCPYAHGGFCYLLPQVHWRDSSAVGDVLPTPAPGAGLPEDWYPEPCVVPPERVTEYPSWTQEPVWPGCEGCGSRMSIF
ncbi:hypothetical protein [Streptomyces sp. DSM 40907]|uniref:hypothetical protein n=1 Tax=Streptomyces kutzneri TaxID=3051179 RepID=UPI0028D3051A|nr:hypothetical protein [Streptomyces sp. DSM 40907]